MVSGLKQDFGMERELNFGKTGRSTSATGEMILLTEKVDSFMLMAMFSKVTGSMTKPKEEELMNMRTEPVILVTGKKTVNTVTESRLGQTTRDMKVPMNTERSTA